MGAVVVAVALACLSSFGKPRWFPKFIKSDRELRTPACCYFNFNHSSLTATGLSSSSVRALPS